MSGTNQPSEAIPTKAPSRTGLYVAIAVIVVIAVVLSGLYVAGYLTPKSTPPKAGACTSYTIKGAGSTFVAGLMTAWTTMGGYPTNAVDYAPVGSGTGISDITTKTVNYGASDAPLNASQAALAPGLLTMPETAGAVSVIFNLQGTTFHLGDSLNLTGSVLAAIYLGTVSWWNDTAITSLNPGVTLPSQQIAVYHRADGSGTSYAFTQFLSDSNTTWKNTVGYGVLPHWPLTPVGGGESGSSKIAGAVKNTPNSLGYVDLGYAALNQISYAAVQNPSGKNVVPTVLDSGQALTDLLATTTLPAGSASWSAVSMINAPGAGDYPIVTLSYLLFYQKAEQNPLVLSAGDASSFGNFLNWTINQGQTYSGSQYYIPLPSGVVTADEATLASMTYNGGTVASCT